MKKSNYKRKEVAKKVTGRIALGLVVVFSALIVIITMSIRKDLVKREQDKLTLLATENASIAREFMESMLHKQGVLINTIKSLGTIDEEQKVEMLDTIISSMKKEEKNALSVFYIAEPNALLANTPDGYSIFATEQGVQSKEGRFQYVNQALYESVKKSKQMTVVDPFKKTIDGKDYMVITVVLPILNAKEEVVGVVGSNIDAALLNGAEYNNGGFETFSMEIICGHQTMIANSKLPDTIGKAYVEASDSKNAETILETANNAVTRNLLDTGTDGEKYYKSYVPFYLEGSSVVWLSGSSIAKSEFDAQILKQSTSIAIWLVVGLLVLTLIAYFRLKVSLKPISTLEEAVEELAKGNLQCKIEFTSDDELGALADCLRESMKTLSEYVTDIDRAMSEMAEGNFNLAPSQPFVGDFQNIEVSITKFIVKMSSTLQYMTDAAEQVSMGAEQVAQGAQALAESTTEEANSVDELSAELLEVSARTKTNATNAMDVNILAGAVSEKIFTSNNRMHEMSDAMMKISQSSEEIGEIIKTLEDISAQTNMLALNVAIEAARAGAAGKSFAVVADEVRKLASKSSEAAKQTGLLIADSIQSVRNGVSIAQETAESLSQVVSGASDITKLIEAISEASKEQSNSITEITDGIEQILLSVQTNSATSEESAAASEELSSQAEGMRALVSKFKLNSQVNSFDVE